jgi:hypothetical protein
MMSALASDWLSLRLSRPSSRNCLPVDRARTPLRARQGVRRSDYKRSLAEEVLMSPVKQSSKLMAKRWTQIYGMHKF